MFFGTRKQLKITQAVRVSSLLAYTADHHQLGFQAWILDEDSIQYFDNTEAFLFQANKPCAVSMTDLNLGISLVLRDIAVILAKSSLYAKGSLVYLLSDFSDFEKTHQVELARLNEQCFIQAIHFLDKAEFELPIVGKLRLQAMHDDRNYQLDTYKQKDQEAFSQLSRQYFEIRKSLIKDLGIAYKQLETDAENLQEYVSLPLGRA